MKNSPKNGQTKTKIEPDSVDLPRSEAAHRTKIMIKSLPPTRMAPLGAGSVHL